ncbi:MAG: hypothetical protein N2D54_10445 [Chloroflexota bacterium]
MNKKLILTITLFASISMACGLSVNGNQNSGGLSEDQIVETMVAETLQSKSIDNTAAATEMPQSQPTLAPAEATATETTLPTASLEPTATLTPVPTATSVPTLSPSDPKTTLGSPDETENFSNGNSWYLYSDATAKADVKDGRFFYSMLTPNFGAEWTVTVPRSKNYYIEVESEITSDCTGKDNYGFMFRVPNDSTNAGYLFGFSCDGKYRLLNWDGSNFNTLDGWAASSEINPGKNKTNRIGAKVEDSVISLYANGVKIATINNNKHKGTRYGFYIHSVETDNFTAAFDNLLYWKLP